MGDELIIPLNGHGMWKFEKLKVYSLVIDKINNIKYKTTVITQEVIDHWQIKFVPD